MSVFYETFGFIWGLLSAIAVTVAAFLPAVWVHAWWMDRIERRKWRERGRDEPLVVDWCGYTREVKVRCGEQELVLSEKEAGKLWELVREGVVS